MSKTVPNPVAELEAAAPAPAPAAPATPKAPPGMAPSPTPPAVQDGPPAGHAFLDPNAPIPVSTPGVPAPGTPGAPAPGTVTVPEGLTHEAALSFLFPETPDFLKGQDGNPDAKQLADWKAFRALQTELGKKLDSGEGSTAALDAYKKEHQESITAMQEWQSRVAIENTPAFREKYDQGRITAKTQVETFAASAGLTPQDAAAILAQPDELAVVKLLGEKLKDDPAAQQLIGEHARNFVRLGAERNAALQVQDPAAALDDWKKQQSQLDGQAAMKLAEEEKAASVAAVEKLMTELPSKDPYYTTATGAKTLATVKSLVEGNTPLGREDVFRAFAEADAKEVYAQAYAVKSARVQELEAQVASLQGLRPGSQSTFPPGTTTPLPGTVPSQPTAAPVGPGSTAGGSIKIQTS